MPERLVPKGKPDFSGDRGFYWSDYSAERAKHQKAGVQNRVGGEDGLKFGYYAKLRRWREKFS